jgi:GT2 family glycosyltransferase
VAPISSVGIILVAYNQKQNFGLLFTSLSKQSFKDFTIYFVDNNSDSSDEDACKKINARLNLDIIYIKPGSNTGFAGGNNLGAEDAIKNGCKYIFFLNNDTELHEKCIEELVRVLESNPKAAVAAPIIFYGESSNPKLTIQEFGAKTDFRKYKINKYFEGQKFYLVADKLPDEMKVDLVSGGATFAKAKALTVTGLWEESYFAYGDEIDFAKRINEAGYESLAVSSAKLWHNHKWDKSNKRGFYFEYYLIQRNKYLYFKKYHLTVPMLAALFLDWIKFPRKLIWFIKVCDFKLGMYYLKGTLHGLMNKKGKPKF